MGEILDHIHTTYTNISATNMRKNITIIKTVHDPNLAIETLIDQIKNVVD